MNETEIKTRLGLVLQEILAEALTIGGLTYSFDFQYDSSCEKPDFLVPDEKNPKYMIEVHQSSARTSFLMKVLRTFTAVMEAKLFYGNELISINILFGNPAQDIQASSVSAMCGFFDANLVPREDKDNGRVIAELENKALEYSGNSELSVKQIKEKLLGNSRRDIVCLSQTVMKIIRASVPNNEIDSMWSSEAARLKILPSPPTAGQATYFKRMILKSLFLKDESFNELLVNKNVSLCTEETLHQLLNTKLVTVEEELDGDAYVLDFEFERFLANEASKNLHDMCNVKVASSPEMMWFFEDIRDKDRRQKMAKEFINVATQGEEKFREAFSESFTNGDALGIAHSRCWMADLMPIVIGESHNFFNNAIFVNKKYEMPLGNPYNNIAIRSARLGKNQEELSLYQELACDVFFEEVKSRSIDLSALGADELANQLLKFRLDAAIKLKKMDPLLLIIEETCKNLGLALSPVTIDSIIGDLSGSSSAGRFRLYEIKNSEAASVLLNVVSVHDHNGDHKSKEWGARRLATLYRYDGKEVLNSKFTNGLFVLDGEWEDKDVARLYRSGWNYICRLGDLEEKLKEIFRQ